MRLTRIGKYLVKIIAAGAALVLLSTAVLVVAGFRDNIGNADLALVPGRKVEADGTPSPRLRARLDRTLELFREGRFPAVIVSGGFGKEGFDEASVMRDYLVAHGIPDEHVILDQGGTTTFMSARNTLSIARGRKLTSVFVVTQYFHVPRTRLALRRFGFATVYSAHARHFEGRDIYSSFRELPGYLNYLFRDYDADAVKAD